MDDHTYAVFRRMRDACITSTQRKALYRTAKEIEAEQRAGRTFSLREFCIRLLVSGIHMSETDAARTVDDALAQPMPAHLRAMMD